MSNAEEKQKDIEETDSQLECYTINNLRDSPDKTLARLKYHSWLRQCRERDKNEADKQYRKVIIFLDKNRRSKYIAKIKEKNRFKYSVTDWETRQKNKGKLSVLRFEKKMKKMDIK